MQSFDAIILGAGYTGPLLATVLGRQGFRVAIVETAPLPRVAIGESSTPEQNRLHAWLSRRWGIPELRPLASYFRMKRSRLPIAVWPKESFYFLADPERTARADFVPGRPPELAYQTPPWPIGPDMHLFRADLDTYLLSVAVRYGATVFGMATIEEIDANDAPVRVRIVCDAREEILEAPVLFDCSGFGSKLARDLDLRVAEPPEIGLRSRAIFNHFVGTRALEDTFARDWPRLPIPRDHATVHLVAPEGWCWYIPFDNGITSVGLLLNQEIPECVEPESDAAVEFRRRGDAHPAFAAMMRDARAVRPWTSTGRLQWRTSRVIDDRWILLPPSSGFTDPLYSAGMAMSAVAVSRIAERSDDILRRGVPLRQALPDYESFFRTEIEYVARIQQMFYHSTADFELLCAAIEVYRMGTLVGGLQSGIPGVHPHLQPLWGSGHGIFREIVDAAFELVRDGLANGGDPVAVSAALRALTREREPWGFVSSALNHPKNPNIHLVPISATMRFAKSIGAGRGWLDLMRSMVFDRPAPALPVAPGVRKAGAPRTRALADLVSRHVRILLGTGSGSEQRDAAPHQRSSSKSLRSEAPKPARKAPPGT